MSYVHADKLGNGWLYIAIPYCQRFKKSVAQYSQHANNFLCFSWLSFEDSRWLLQLPESIQPRKLPSTRRQDSSAAAVTPFSFLVSFFLLLSLLFLLLHFLLFCSTFSKWIPSWNSVLISHISAGSYAFSKSITRRQEWDYNDWPPQTQ